MSVRFYRIQRRGVDQMGHAGPNILGGGGPAPDPTPQKVDVLASTEDIIIDGETFSPAIAGATHTLLVGYDSDNTILWKVHVRSQAGQQLDSVNPYNAPGLIHPDGFVIVPLRAGTTNSTTNPLGVIADSLVDIIPESGPTTTLTMKANNQLSGWQLYHDLLMRVDIDGSVKWASPGYYTDQQIPQGAWWEAEGLRDIDGDKFACWFNFVSYYNFPVNPRTATFMPATDGTVTQGYVAGESWNAEINYEDGKLALPSVEILSLNFYSSPGRYHGKMQTTPSVVTDSGFKAMAMTGIRYASDQTQYTYRGHSNPGWPFVQDAPVPGYPTNMRWDNSHLNSIFNRACMVMMREANNNIRYGLQLDQSPDFVRGLASPVGTDDLLIGWRHAGNGTNTRIRRDSLDEGVYEASLANGSTLAPIYGGSVVKLVDNPGTPDEPTWPYQVSFGMFEFQLGGATNTTQFRNGPYLMEDTDDLFVCSAIVNGAGNVKWHRANIDPIVRLEVNRLFGAPTFYSGLILSARISDFRPQYVIALETDIVAIVVPDIIRKGREMFAPVVFRDNLKVHHWTREQLGVIGTYGANAVELDLVASGNNVAIMRFDITTGVYKGHTIDGVDDVTDALSIGSGLIRKGVCDVSGDVPEVLLPVGNTNDTAAPVVVNATGSPVFSEDAGNPIPAFSSLNSGTGVVTLTPAAPDIGVHGFALKATDSLSDYSYTNMINGYVEPYPDIRFDFDEVSGTTAVDHFGGPSGTYQANALLNQTGQIDKSFDTQRLINGGVNLPSFTLGTEFTYSTWLDCRNHTVIDDGAEIFVFRLGTGSNYRIHAMETSSGNCRMQVYSAAGATIGTLDTGNFYLTAVGFQKWTFWCKGTSFGMMRGGTSWSATLSSAFPSGLRDNNVLAPSLGARPSFNAKFDHSEIWLTHALNARSPYLAYLIELGNVAAYP